EAPTLRKGPSVSGCVLLGPAANTTLRDGPFDQRFVLVWACLVVGGESKIDGALHTRNAKVRGVGAVPRESAAVQATDRPDREPVGRARPERVTRAHTIA